MVDPKLKWALGAIFLVAIVYTINRPAGLTLFVIALMAMALNYYQKGGRFNADS